MKIILFYFIFNNGEFNRLTDILAVLSTRELRSWVNYVVNLVLLSLWEFAYLETNINFGKLGSYHVSSLIIIKNQQTRSSFMIQDYFAYNVISWVHYVSFS